MGLAESCCDWTAGAVPQGGRSPGGTSLVRAHAAHDEKHASQRELQDERKLRCAVQQASLESLDIDNVRSSTSCIRRTKWRFAGVTDEQQHKRAGCIAVSNKPASATVMVQHCGRMK
eukprot:1160628-Pelagomonas_calceolata.AAC.17